MKVFRCNKTRLPHSLVARSVSKPVIPVLDTGIHSVNHPQMKQFCVYILASKKNGTLYVGVTSNLAKRVFEQRRGLYDGFSKKYSIKRLVWYEMQDSAIAAIQREKNIKSWNREWKIKLIEEMNPEWFDLYLSLNR